MKINVGFESLEELQEFAKKVNGFGSAEPLEKAAQQSAQSPVPQQQPPVQQQQPPVQQTVEPPVQQPPVQQPPAQQPPAQQPPVQQTQAQPGVPTTTVPQNYTSDQLARAAATLMEAGKQAQLMQLLGEFGIQALTQLPQERYADFATRLRSEGAVI